jgi:hypothetical protein
VRDDAVRNYAGALKYALALRRAGLLSPTAETELGRMLQNIGRFATCSMIRRGQLKFATRRDPDFDLDVTMYACQVCDRVDLTQSGEAIFGYIVQAVKNRIKNRLRNAATMKRSAELVGIDAVTLPSTDIFGNIEQTTRSTP